MFLAALGELEEGIAQEGGVAVVEILQRLHRLSRIGEALARIGLRRDDRLDGSGIDSVFHDPL